MGWLSWQACNEGRKVASRLFDRQIPLLDSGGGVALAETAAAFILTVVPRSGLPMVLGTATVTGGGRAMFGSF